MNTFYLFLVFIPNLISSETNRCECRCCIGIHCVLQTIGTVTIDDCDSCQTTCSEKFPNRCDVTRSRHKISSVCTNHLDQFSLNEDKQSNVIIESSDMKQPMEENDYSLSTGDEEQNKKEQQSTNTKEIIVPLESEKRIMLNKNLKEESSAVISPFQLRSTSINSSRDEERQRDVQIETSISTKTTRESTSITSKPTTSTTTTVEISSSTTETINTRIPDELMTSSESPAKGEGDTTESSLIDDTVAFDSPTVSTDSTTKIIDHSKSSTPCAKTNRKTNLTSTQTHRTTTKRRGITMKPWSNISTRTNISQSLLLFVLVVFYTI